MSALGPIAAYPLGCECCSIVSAFRRVAHDLKPGDHVITNVKSGCFCDTIRAPAEVLEGVSPGNCFRYCCYFVNCLLHRQSGSLQGRTTLQRRNLFDPCRIWRSGSSYYQSLSTRRSQSISHHWNTGKETLAYGRTPHLGRSLYFKPRWDVLQRRYGHDRRERSRYHNELSFWRSSAALLELHCSFRKVRRITKTRLLP